jgi:hypothetical protein
MRSLIDLLYEWALVDPEECSVVNATANLARAKFQDFALHTVSPVEGTHHPVYLTRMKAGDDSASADAVADAIIQHAVQNAITSRGLIFSLDIKDGQAIVNVSQPAPYIFVLVRCNANNIGQATLEAYLDLRAKAFDVFVGQGV